MLSVDKTVGQYTKVRTPHKLQKNWADELRKFATANIALHVVLTKKSELNLNGKDVYPTSLHKRILTSRVFSYCVKRSLHKSRLIKAVVVNLFVQSPPYRNFASKAPPSYNFNVGKNIILIWKYFSANERLNAGAKNFGCLEPEPEIWVSAPQFWFQRLRTLPLAVICKFFEACCKLVSLSGMAFVVLA